MFAGLLLGATLIVGPMQPGLPDKPVIRSTADLPPTTFSLDGRPSDVFLGANFMAITVPALRTEAERLLADYDIQDPVILQRLRTGLASIANLEGRHDEALRLIAAQRGSETKPQLKAIGFMFGEGIAAGRLGQAGARCDVAAARVRALLDEATADVVRDEVVQYFGQIQVASPGYYAGTAAGVVDPAYETRGSINVVEGMRLAMWRMNTFALPSCRDEIAGVLSAWLAAPGHQPLDVWAAREPAADLFTHATPVTVAIWDGGFDPSLFAGRLAIDPAEPLDGRDNDGNGVVDDVNGPTFDHRLQPTRFPYPPLSEFLEPRFALQVAVRKGELDLGYGLDTPEARFFAQRGREASTEEQGIDVDSAGEIGARSHGTAVASIIARDAPWVRLYNLYALPWAEAPGPIPYSEPEIARWVGLFPSIGERLRGAGVRVVNMSWGVWAPEFAESLIRGGFETDPERARVRGQAMYDQVATGLRTLIESCPDILFVTGSGNSNQPDEVLAAAPQTFRMRNLIVAGATAGSGRASAFTTFGETVSIYALGENIPILLPGGVRLHGEGTSYASPGVAHAAAAMLAVNPGLTPVELVEGLKATATEGEGGLRLLHLGRAVEWAKSRRPRE